MKYLKKFNEGISNEYYEPVDSSMFDDRTQIVFTDDEIYMTVQRKHRSL